MEFHISREARDLYQFDEFLFTLAGNLILPNFHAQPSSIVLIHMNHPESETAEGVEETIPELKERGFRFVRLEE